jgi:hypothetical protein
MIHGRNNLDIERSCAWGANCSDLVGGEIMTNRGDIQLILTHEEATDLFFRCLQSPDEDNPISELVLSKLARAISIATEDDIRRAA